MSHEDCWRVIYPTGEVKDLSDSRSSLDESLERLTQFEMGGETPLTADNPPHIRPMHEQELFQAEPLSEGGHMRAYPAGKQLRDVLADYCQSIALELGAQPVETPIVYREDQSEVGYFIDGFGDKQYRLRENSLDHVLRFATDFGHLSIFSDMNISYRDLPLSLYELGTYAFRNERSGELSGLYRQRAFTLPDIHTLTKDRATACDEILRYTDIALTTSMKFGVDYEVEIHVAESELSGLQPLIEDIATTVGEPILLRILPEHQYYWSMKVDFLAMTQVTRPQQCATIHLDTSTADEFDLMYSTADGTAVPCLLHFAPIGSIERMIATILDSSVLSQPSALPTPLATTQVRLIPVRDDHIEYCELLAGELRSSEIRIDIDDRNATVSRKVKRAEERWLPYYAVVGDDELNGDLLSVTVRNEQKEISMSVQNLKTRICRECTDYPRTGLYLSRRLSDRPTFH